LTRYREARRGTRPPQVGFQMKVSRAHFQRADSWEGRELYVSSFVG
jgi:hypothetical protein